MRQSWAALAAAFCTFGIIAGCGGVNNSIQYNTGATVTNISPSAAEAGGTVDFTLTVTSSPGNPFQVGTVVEWNGQKLSTVPLTAAATTVTATVPHALVAKPGTAYVNTLEPQSGAGNNGLSNALTFLIYGNPNPIPVLTSVSPSTASACTSNCASVTITLRGSNFLPTSTNGGSSVTYTGAATVGVETAISVSSISATQIKAIIPGSYLGQADTAQINVINPPSAVCLVNCPNLGGGDTKNQTPPTTQTFTIGAGTQSGTSTAAGAAEETPAVSQDGRYVAFTSQQNGVAQILVRDTCVGAARGCAASSSLASEATDGTDGNEESHTPAMSADGRYIAFSSAATNLVEGAPAGRQIYIRDTCAGAAASCKPSTSLISIDSAGALNGIEAILPSISASGRFVAFVAITKSNTPPNASSATSASGSTNSGLRQVFVRDTCLGAADCTPKTTRISLQPGDGTPSAAKPAGPAISGLAKQVALPEGKTSTVFTQAIPVDDRVFLAITTEQN